MLFDFLEENNIDIAIAKKTPGLFVKVETKNLTALEWRHDFCRREWNKISEERMSKEGKSIYVAVTKFPVFHDDLHEKRQLGIETA